MEIDPRPDPRGRPTDPSVAGEQRATWLDLGLDVSLFTPDERRRVRILSGATLAMVAIAAGYFVNHLVLGLVSMCIALGLAASAALANLALLRWTRRPVASAHLGVAILTAVLCFSAYTTGGFYDPNFAWLYLVPVCAVVILDHRGATFWALVTLGITVAFWTAPQLGIELVNQIPAEMQSGQALSNRLTAVIAMGLIAASFVSGQRRAERELARANEDLSRESAYVQLLQHAAEAANEAPSFQEAMQLGVERICATMGWAVGHVALVGEDETIASSGFSHTPDPVRFAPLRNLTEEAVWKRGEGLSGRALERGAPECIFDLEQMVRELGQRARVAREAGLRSAFAVPVKVHGRVRAVLEFADNEPLAADDRLVEVFAHVGDQLGRVAERTALHEGLRQSQKMEAVGQLAAGLAHEINNPMSYVRSNLGMLLELWRKLAPDLPRGSDDDETTSELRECEELVEEALDGVERTIAIVRDVREFSHFGGGSRISWSEAEASDLIEGALRVALSQASPDIHFERDYAETPWLRCSPSQLRQVFVNLIVNAIQAVGERGVIRLSTEVEGDRVVARIEDDGPGMDAETRARLFDPFFTTKGVGEGTGLGLYVSYEIVNGHDGEIAVRSDPGQGSTFEVRLPIPPAEDPQSGAESEGSKDR